MQECFERVYAITVNRSEYSSNEEMLERLAGGDSAYDLIQPTDYMIPSLAKNGLLEQFDHRRLPNLQNIEAAYLDLSFDPGNKFSIPYMAGTDGIVYNASTVPDPPAAWADLWNPEYAGRMVFTDDSRVVIGMTLLSLNYDPNTRDPVQLEQARQKLEQLIPNVRLFDSDSPSTVLIPGDVDLGITWTGEAFIANQGNPDIQYVYPAEGSFLWQDNWAMPTGAAHADAAYAWLSYTMQGDIFWLMLRDFPYTMPNRAALEYARINQAALYAAYVGSPITNTPRDAINNGHRIEDIGDAGPLYDGLWAEVTGQ
jgi:spermidine/putrescine-binding protein